MKRLFLTSALCLSLTACETVDLGELSSSVWNIFDTPVEEVEVEKLDTEAVVNQSAVATELSEMQKLTGTTPRVMNAQTPDESLLAEDNAELAADTNGDINVNAERPATIVEQTTQPAQAPTTPQSKPKIAALPASQAPVSKPAQPSAQVPTPPPAEMMTVEPLQKEAETMSNAQATKGAEGAPAPVAQEDPKEPIDMQQTVIASGCPKIVILPATRSLTFFEDGGIGGQMTARASIHDVRGGCEVVDDGMEVDLDIIMRGRITDKGRFEGNRNEEAFVTFPYFTTITTPRGLTIEKKIMATAMRFRPLVDNLDHAEKITQFIPMSDPSKAEDYQIIVGFQLTREQLNYNRALIQARPDDDRISPDTSPAERRSYNPLVTE